MEVTDCFICRKHKGEIVIPGGCIYENDYVYVGHVGSPDSIVYLGYVIIDLKRHAPGIGDLTEAESHAVGSVLNRVGKALKTTEKAEHIYSFVQGDAFPHFHIHVIPRYPNTPHEYWNPIGLKNWNEAHGGVKETKAVCSRLRDYLNR